jgi:hypothetical protein
MSGRRVRALGSGLLAAKNGSRVTRLDALGMDRGIRRKIAVPWDQWHPGALARIQELRASLPDLFFFPPEIFFHADYYPQIRSSASVFLFR